MKTTSSLRMPSAVARAIQKRPARAIGASASRTRDAGLGESYVRARPLATGGGQRFGGFTADGALVGKQRSRDADSPA